MKHRSSVSELPCLYYLQTHQHLFFPCWIEEQLVRENIHAPLMRQPLTPAFNPTLNCFLLCASSSGDTGLHCESLAGVKPLILSGIIHRVM